MSKTVYMRGLQVFISDIRAAPNKEAEQKRVEKELTKIKAKFAEDKPLSGYDRRKYIWKLLYIYMLGYDIEFGHRQACDLIPAPKYSDKQVGYMACSLLLRENDEFLRLAINGIHMDLTSRNEAFHCLALGFAGNMAGTEMADALILDVIKLLQHPSSRPIVKKKAALCLLRLLRKTPLDQVVIQPETFCSTLTGLLEERDLGLLLSSVTLLYGICTRTGAVGYDACQSRVIRLLERLVANKDVPPDYTYYGIASPWLQCKCLRMLQFFPAPEAAVERRALNDCLAYYINRDIGDGTHKSSNPNKANAQNAMLFEAIALALHLETEKSLLTASVTTLGKFLSFKEPNIKYLALENLSRLALLPDILDAIRHHKVTVLASLKDPDISIRRRAMDLLFTLCDAATADDIVAELLKNLSVADLSMREELVLKIAILAEKFALTQGWYIESMMTLLEKGGEHVRDEVWHRIVTLISLNEPMQQMAAKAVTDNLRKGTMLTHECFVSLAAYVLGDHGRLIQDQVSASEQHRLLYAAFPAAMQATKSVLLVTFVKLMLTDPNNPTLKRDTVQLFEKYKKFMDSSDLQRASDAMASPTSPAVIAALVMPKWVDKEGTLLRRLQRHEGVEGLTDVPSTADQGDGVAGGVVQAPVARVLSGEKGPAPGAASYSQSNGAAPSTSQQQHPPPLQGLPNSSFRQAPSSDLMSLTSPPTVGPSGAWVAPPPPRPAAVDLLSDLFEGASVSQGSYGAPPQQQQQQAGPSSNNPFAAAMPSSAHQPTQQQQQTYSPSYGNPPAESANPFATQTPPPPLPPPAPQHASSFSSSAAAPSAASAAGFDAFMGDPFGDNAFAPPPPPPPPPPPVVVVEPPRLTGDLQQWFNNLTYKDRGILYEDQYLQVGLQSQYGGGACAQITVFFGNKHTELELSRLVCYAASTPSLSVEAGPAPQQLGPKQQLQVVLQLRALGPLEGPPVLQLGYSVGGLNHLQELRLPVGNHRFLVPEAAIAREVFFEQWKVYSAPPHKAQEMVDRPAPMAPEYTVLAMLRSVGLGAEHAYLDPSDHNEAGAALFVCGPAGQETSTRVLCRVEGNPATRAQFRVTVSSPSPVLASSIQALLVQQVRGAP